MPQDNNQNEIQTSEVAFTLKRTIKRQNKKIIGVFRSFYVNGECIYTDNISRELWLNSLDSPDIFGMVELFSMGNNAPIKLPPSFKNTMTDNSNIYKLFKRFDNTALIRHFHRINASTLRLITLLSVINSIWIVGIIVLLLIRVIS